MAKYPRVLTNIDGLTEDQLRGFPAIYATSAHKDRSAKYQFIPTVDVLNGLFKHGYVPTTVMQSLSRDETQHGFTRHLVRLTHSDDLGLYDKRGREFKEKREVVVINSSNGTSAYEVLLGIFRMICANGMIAGDFDHTKIYHKGNSDDIAARVVEGSLKVIEQSAEVMETIEEMKQVQLTWQESLLLAKYVMEAKFGTPAEGLEVTDLTIYKPQDFLDPLHEEDRGKRDIWTTGNTIEEHLTGGGVTRKDVRGKKHTTRATESIKSHLDIHQRLWMFQKEMLELKKSQH